MHNEPEILSDQRPSRVRYGVMGFLCSLAFILYIDRICIGQAATLMMKDLGVDEATWAWVGVAFQIAYAIFEPMTGHWGDRYGSRRVLIRIVLWWSVFTALTGCVWKFSWQVGENLVLFNGFALLLLIRFLFGAGEAGALPNAARVISVWFPPGKRGPAQAMISTSAQIGGAGAPALAAFMISVPFIGWRGAFVIFGSLGLIWIWFFALWYRDDPVTHPEVNDAERRYIQAGRAAKSAATPEEHRLPWSLIFSNRNVWLLGCSNACTSFFSYMLFFWFPTYLKKGRGLEELGSGGLGSLPYMFGAIGVLFGGYFGDWLTARTGSRRGALVGMSTISLLLAGTMIASSVQMNHPAVAVLFCSIGYFFSYIQLAAWWAAVADVGGRHTGAIFGLCNMIGLAGGAISQIFLGQFVTYMATLGYSGRDQWDPAFYLYGAVLMLGGLLWLFVDPKRTVEPADTAHD